MVGPPKDTPATSSSTQTAIIPELGQFPYHYPRPIVAEAGYDVYTGPPAADTTIAAINQIGMEQPNREWLRIRRHPNGHGDTSGAQAVAAGASSRQRLHDASHIVGVHPTPH